jgi:hypothetical protein
MAPVLQALAERRPGLDVTDAPRSMLSALELDGGGDPAAALERMIESSWGRLTGLGALRQASEEHLPAERVHRAHAPLMERVGALVARGQASGAFRADLDPGWLVTVYFALVHAADDHARASGADRDRALAELTMSVRAVFDARA